MEYEHRQVGYLIVVTLGLVLALFGFVAVQAGFEAGVMVIMTLVVLLLLSFVTLTVKVNSKIVQVKFGYGLVRKSFPVSDIVSVKKVRNKWYYGWGIRVWLWPKMVIFNVSGFDAVEIVMKDGKVFRIGTDEPGKLECELFQVINT